jgi:hypothetical protein
MHRIAIPVTPSLPMFELAIPCEVFEPGRRDFPVPWMHVGELTRRWPAVRVEPSVLYTDDGQILTSAGSAAGLDLCLHIVCNDHGTRIANTLARRLVIPPHREGGQAQYIEQPLAATRSQSLGPSLDWAREHLELPLTVEDLARQAMMTPRTYARPTGTTPQPETPGPATRTASRASVQMIIMHLGPASSRRSVRYRSPARRRTCLSRLRKR